MEGVVAKGRNTESFRQLRLLFINILLNHSADGNQILIIKGKHAD